VGPSGRVVAFEPDPVACASLRKNLELNDITNVTVEEQVVSERVGEAVLATDRFGSGLSSIVPSAHGETKRQVKVPSTTLDEYCRVHGLSPDWVKIDAEGAEPLVIRGMQSLIEKVHPSVILEFHSEGMTDDERRTAWSAITARALSVVVLESGPDARDYLRQIPREVVPDRGFLMVSITY
jgi:FkbM family methyltransferase